jgi:hypothetical protein
VATVVSIDTQLNTNRACTALLLRLV